MSLSSSLKAKSPLAYHRILSPSASIKVSPICLGSMNFGEIWKGLLGKCSKDTAFSIMDHFHASGGNFIDTANMYMAGESEKWIGEWMTARNLRDQMVIATKYTVSPKFAFLEPEESILSNYGGTNKKSLRLSLSQSLKNLQTDYVDVLYVHGWEDTASIPELMQSLDLVVRDGKALYLGVCNWPAWVVVKANEYARQHALTPFVVYEGRWNPVDREIERDVVPMCKAEGMGITVWSALGGGKFKDKTTAEKKSGRSFTDDLGGASPETYKKFGAVMEDIGKNQGSDALGVALRYCMLKAPYVIPIIGGRKFEHLQKNIDALKINLSEADIEKIEAVVPFDFGYPHSIASSNRYEPISSSYPAFFIRDCCLFDGVEEVKVRCPTEIQTWNPC
ncbi:sterigmatocystin biosynthesis dehydrogenase stcV [Rhizodiscina lignyota]|uniref:Sterigmatocystin biosynthesis dehydrogenase stcV n=1 Tax=Rhizodiscina lignyota TaxID=1504668 RepID=A0A9P4IF69_9PEZI|nr:sterigmatocystin biosynthesis dehydrogenase stcV [Rhizodiscina lignyota]